MKMPHLGRFDAVGIVPEAGDVLKRSDRTLQKSQRLRVYVAIANL